ncbi:putative transcriptional regulator, TetR family protein [Gordonia spumicola]|uniref:Putative transcriptional regulator, TetR family protein n=1 Tax=Gordonia spumicola TaxID=589161 RepID=A0A7I9VC14_9ACTN|nr:TetR/AcrR family transcriptional regulator [Gordonia spumicola]GEE02916.1 putative transcriptional regulator, TetR family protein [Gordonia spumicola]
MVYIESAERRRQAIDAARTALMREGVGRVSMRVVAAEAGIPLGTLQYVFPTKLGLLEAVIDDLVAEIGRVLSASATVDGGLETSIRDGVRTFWSRLVVDHSDLQLLQYELVTHALRTPGLQDLPRRQYDLYVDTVTRWFTAAAERSGETAAVEYDQLARLLVGGIDGLLLQSVVAPDADRSAADLERVIDMVVAVAGISS